MTAEGVIKGQNGLFVKGTVMGNICFILMLKQAGNYHVLDDCRERAIWQECRFPATVQGKIKNSWAYLLSHQVTREPSHGLEEPRRATT